MVLLENAADARLPLAWRYDFDDARLHAPMVDGLTESVKVLELLHARLEDRDAGFIARSIRITGVHRVEVRWPDGRGRWAQRGVGQIASIGFALD
jgi:hypothetical protein